MKKEEFGIRLRQARKAKGYTTQKMAELINVTSGEYYSRYERGKRLPPPDTIVKLCNILEITPNYLFADSIESLEKFSFETQYSMLGLRDQKIIENLISNMFQTLDIKND